MALTPFSMQALEGIILERPDFAFAAAGGATFFREDHPEFAVWA